MRFFGSARIAADSGPGSGKRVEETLPSSGVTWRAALIGTLLSILLGYLAICEHALGGGLSADAFGTGALFLLFALICGVGLLKRIGAVRTGLRPQEMLVVFSMLLMVSAVPINGTIMYLIPKLAGFTHYATPANEWGSRVLPLLPDGLTIKDAEVAKGFFEGVGPERGTPYGEWVGPLLAWAVLLGAFYFTMISLMVIFRRRWMEEERLPFPIAQVPLALVAHRAADGPLLQNRVFWAGFAVPALLGLSTIVQRFIPFVGAPNLSFYVYFGNKIQVFGSINYIAVGISYLASLEILGSILLFTLTTYIQLYLQTMFSSPFLESGPWRPRVIYGYLHQEALGGLLVLAGFGVYEARHHLRNVLRKASGAAPEVDDGEEMLSYRAATLGILVCVAFICYWLWVTGISLWVMPVFVLLILAIFLGVTRILAESGVVLQAPMSPMQVLLHSVGTSTLGPSTTAGFFMAQPWAFADGAHYMLPNGSHAMASVSTTLRLTYRKGVRTRPLFFICFLALLAGGGAAAVTLLHYAYALGAYGFAKSDFVVQSLNYHLNYYAGVILNPSEGQPIRILWTGIGAAVAGLLILARKQLFWWPIHPIAYPVGTIYLSFWFNVLVAWLIKRNVLKYGGPSLYGRSQPFFFGLILGQAVVSSVGSIVALLTGRA